MIHCSYCGVSKDKAGCAFKLDYGFPFCIDNVYCERRKSRKKMRKVIGTVIAAVIAAGLILTVLGFGGCGKTPQEDIMARGGVPPFKCTVFKSNEHTSVCTDGYNNLWLCDDTDGYAHCFSLEEAKVFMEKHQRENGQK